MYTSRYSLSKLDSNTVLYTIRHIINRYTHSNMCKVHRCAYCMYVHRYVHMYILTYICTYVCTQEQYVTLTYHVIHTQVLFVLHICTYICTLCKPCEDLTCDITADSVTVQGVTMVTCAETRSNCVDTPMLTPTVVNNTFVNVCRSREQ